MHFLPANIKQFVAAFLLGLLVFILAEKNAHTHDGISNVHQQNGLPIAHTGFSCFICEYQLTGDADEPVVFTVSTVEYLSSTLIVSLTQLYYTFSIPGTGERGPPAFC